MNFFLPMAKIQSYIQLCIGDPRGNDNMVCLVDQVNEIIKKSTFKHFYRTNKYSEFAKNKIYKLFICTLNYSKPLLY